MFTWHITHLPVPTRRYEGKKESLILARQAAVSAIDTDREYGKPRTGVGSTRTCLEIRSPYLNSRVGDTN